MIPLPGIKRYFGLILVGTVLVAGDVPTRIAALVADHAHGIAALADDGDGSDGGSDGGGDSDSDSEGGRDSDGNEGSDNDADSGDDDAGNEVDTDSDDADDTDDDEDNNIGSRHRSSDALDAGGHIVQGGPRVPAMPAAPPPLRAAAELVASDLDESTLADLRAAGFRVVRREMLAGKTLVKLRIPRRMTLESARRHIASVSPRSAVDFNHYYRPDSSEAGQIPSCVGKSCFAIELIGWPQSRIQAADCGRGVRIGLVDTAVNVNHPAFSGRHMEVIHLERTEALPDSGRQHGTAVASLLLGAAESRAPGLLPGSEVIAVDAFYRNSAHDERAEVFDLVRSLDILSERGVQAINMSLSGPPNELLEQAIGRLKARNIVLVAAAGNKGAHARPLYPAAYDGVIAVTAIDRGKTVYRHANRGDYIDFAAPGVDVWTAASIKGARRKTGTSFAAPFVTAVAAVMAARDPGKPAAAIQELMAAAAEDLGKPGRDPVFGWGLVSARDICRAATRNVAE